MRASLYSEVDTMSTQICPMLAVDDVNGAIAFYKAAFDATVHWHLDGGEPVVAGLAVDGAPSRASRRAAFQGAGQQCSHECR